MAPTIILEHRVPGLSQRRLAEFVMQACRLVPLPGTVTVLVTNSRRMRMLNARFRGKNQTTDVLSFPGPSFVNGFAGDIAVSVDMAARSAKNLKHSVSEEVEVLVLHGMLHLAGYDHDADQGEMARKEIHLRRQLTLPATLIERADGIERTDGNSRRTRAVRRLRK
jgi:probable rRNA maturation factor